MLRALNCSLALFIVQVSFSILARLYGLLKRKNATDVTARSNERQTALFTNAVHTALNICLFPPLFFFFGLYYTDVPSTFFVLLSYFLALKTQQEKRKFMKFPSVVNTVVLGVAALFFRQTNIFWVAVFPAGLAVVQALKKSAHPTPEDAKEDTIGDVLRNSLMYMCVYDRPVRYASIEGKEILSAAIYHDTLLIRKTRLPQDGHLACSSSSAQSRHGYLLYHSIWRPCRPVRRLRSLEWWRSSRWAPFPYSNTESMSH